MSEVSSIITYLDVYLLDGLLTYLIRSEAWVGSVVAANDLHPVVECSNKGLCDRKTGECQCFTNYEGKEVIK